MTYETPLEPSKPIRTGAHRTHRSCAPLGRGVAWPLAAQSVVARAVDAATAQPVAGALAYLVDANGRSVRSALTDERGRALLGGVPEGRYRVRVEMLGMATAVSEVMEISGEESASVTLRLTSDPIELVGLDVELASDRCTVRPTGDGLGVARLWEEARKALAVAALTQDAEVYRYETLRYEREVERGSEVVLWEETERREGYTAKPFESLPAEVLVTEGFVRPDGAGWLYMAPDAEVLLSDAFLNRHCFHLVGEGTSPEGPGLVGLGFRPTGVDRSVPDIAGTLWLDRRTAEPRWLEYRYEYLDPEWSSDRVGGRVYFERLPNGAWIVPEWWIRMPVLAAHQDPRGTLRISIDRYREEGGRVIEARRAGGRRIAGRDRTGGVEGVVRDSLGSPVQGARVAIVSSNQEHFTDARGRFAIIGLTEGRYRIRIVSPHLEAAGHPGDTLTRDVIPGEMTLVEHLLPSMRDILLEQCADTPWEDDAVIVVGIIRDEQGRPVAGANVRVVWNVFDFSGITVGRQARDIRRTPTGRQGVSGGDGAYHFCWVPARSRLALLAWTDSLESEPRVLVVPASEVGVVEELVLSRPVR